MQIRRLSVRHIPTQIRTVGSGVPQLLLLHGWRSESAAFLPLMKEIWQRDGITSIAVDLPGFGGTPAAREPWTIFDYADFVAELASQLGLEKIAVLGHSFGGRIGIVLASRGESWIEKLILTGAAGVREPSLRRDCLNLAAKIVRPFFKIPVLSKLRPKIYKLLGAEDYTATPELQKTFVNVIEENLSPLLPKIAVPTLLFWGGRDTAAPLDHARQMHDAIPVNEFTVFPRAGHFAFLDEPALTASRIACFVQK